jgi:hypothetical protein
MRFCYSLCPGGTITAYFYFTDPLLRTLSFFSGLLLSKDVYFQSLSLGHPSHAHMAPMSHNMPIQIRVSVVPMIRFLQCKYK